MDITTATAAAPQTTATATSPGPVISSDFETFLRMLTAQARFQDPLKPLDSSEYASQLATFSMVEQQVLGNDLLTELTAQFSAGNMSQMAGWIGMEARSGAPIAFDGTPVTFLPNPAAVADEVFLNVRNEAGAVVQRLQLPVSAEPVQWAGVADNGAPFPPGTYTLEVESLREGETLLAEPAETYARITEARLLDGEAVLILASGAAILADSVTALRAPQGSG